MIRNNTNPASAEQSIKTLHNAFHQRGYPKDILNSSRLAVSKFNQELLLKTRNNNKTSTKDMITYVTTYNPVGPKVKDILTKNIQILQEHPHTSHIKADKLLVAYRRPANLKDILVHSKLNSQQLPHGSFKCNNSKCRLCIHIDTTATFMNELQTKTFSTKGHITCDTEFVIYRINCSLCGKSYVGQTSKTLKTRGNQHIYTIKRSDIVSTPISRHFSILGHTPRNFTIRGICIAPRSEPKRLALESAWIKILGTYAPRGLNVKT